MKSIFFVITICLFIFLQGSFLAQSPDIVYIPAERENGEYYINSLIQFIEADTNTSGEQLHRIYKLERGKFYLIDKPLELKNPVELIAETPILLDQEKPPPKILSDATLEGKPKTENLIIIKADITLKNIWLAGIPVSGGNERGFGEGQALSVQDSFVTVTMNNVWADYNGWSVFTARNPHTKWFIDGLHIRNEQNPEDQWTPFLFYLNDSGIVDTFIVKNCTYFQSNGFFIFPPSVIQYFEVDHCTFVNILKWPFHFKNWLNAKITNSIFYNTGSLGMRQEQLVGSDPEGLPYGIIEADTLIANSSDVIPRGTYDIPEEERTFIVMNNCYYWNEGIEDYFASNDSLVRTPWMNSRTETMFDDDDTWPGFIEENNWNLDPQFDGFTGLAEANEKLVQVCKDIYESNTHEWDWDIDMENDPVMYRLNHNYPLPEYFKSYTGLVGTDGLPIGDLKYNYYDPPTGIMANEETIPENFKLEQNYPNPFNPSTIINYEIPEKCRLLIEVFNTLGEKIIVLADDVIEAGYHRVKFKGSNLASGIYIYRITAKSIETGEQFLKSAKMLLVK